MVEVAPQSQRIRFKVGSVRAHGQVTDSQNAAIGRAAEGKWTGWQGFEMSRGDTAAEKGKTAAEENPNAEKDEEGGRGQDRVSQRPSHPEPHEWISRKKRWR
jgi:hypothetical protein